MITGMSVSQHAWLKFPHINYLRINCKEDPKKCGDGGRDGYDKKNLSTHPFPGSRRSSALYFLHGCFDLQPIRDLPL
jgi:hypothetical protein